MPNVLKRLAFPGWRYALAALVLVASGYLYFGSGTNPGATLTVARGDFREQVNVSGTVTARQDVELGFTASGRIADTLAVVGQHVAAGTVLAETENGDLVAALAQKQAALAQARAALASLEAGTRPEEIAVASAAVTGAQAALIDAIRSAYTTCDDAVRNRVDAFFSNPRSDNPKITFLVANAALETAVERDRAAVESTLSAWALLVSKLTDANVADSAEQAQTSIGQVIALLGAANAAINQGVPDQTTTSAAIASYGSALAIGRANVNAAAAALTSDSAALDAAEKTLVLKQAGPTSQAVAGQQAAVAVAQADIQNARAALAKTRVVAPFAGTVIRMDAKIGAIASPSDTLMSMQNDGVFQIETFVPEVAIGAIAVGNMATATLDAYGSAAPFRAKVIAVDPAETVKDGVPTYKTTLVFLASDPRIRSGMTAQVDIETGTLPNAVVVPAGAVGASGAGPYVTLVEGKRAVNRAVKTGATPSLGQIQIVSGLSAGDVIRLTPAVP